MAKQIQWHWPNHSGEDKFLIMFGGLYIKIVALTSIGTLLKDSGWTIALVLGRSATRTHQAHQITACRLPKLMKAVYINHCAAEVDETPDTF